MKQIDIALYEFIVKNIPNITDEWLSMRYNEAGSIYSLDAGRKVEETLRDQNRLTNLTISSSLLDDPEIFEENKLKWSAVMAESRVKTNTPVEEVLKALSNARTVFWGYVKKFFADNQADIAPEDFIRWCGIINEAFDKIYVNFAAAYNEFMNVKIRSQQKLINVLSSPVIKLKDQIGVVPLVGDIDEARALSMMQTLPEKCQESDIVHLYIDLSSVTTIDTHVAQRLYGTIQVLSLLGTTSILTGMRPEIAYVSTELGLDFSGIPTFSSLQQALEKDFHIEIR